MPGDIHNHLPKNAKATAKEKEPGALLTGVGAEASASNALLTVNIEDLVGSKSLHPKSLDLDKSKEPVVYFDNGPLMQSKNTVTPLKGSARYSAVAEYRFSLKSTEGAHYNVELLPVNNTQKVNVKSTTHFGVDDTNISDPDKLVQTATLVAQAIKSGQPDVTVSIEGRASATGNPDKTIKEVHNQKLSEDRAQTDRKALKELVVAQGVSPEEFDQKVKITQQALGDRDLIEKTLAESDNNRVATNRINNVEIKKGTFHELVVTPENASDLNLNAMRNGYFSITWPKTGPKDSEIAGNPIQEESIAASIRFENAFMTKQTAPIILKGIKNLDNVKIVVDTESLPKDAKLEMGVNTNGQNTLFLTENGNTRTLAAFPIVNENGVPQKLGIIKSVAWRDPQGKEYDNYNGLPLERVKELNNIKHGALEAFNKADVNHDGVLKDKELVDFKINNLDVMKIIDKAEGLKITYDDKNHVSEIDLVSSKNNTTPAMPVVQNVQKR